MKATQVVTRHRFFLILATVLPVLTWLLIILGGVVHGTGSSLACPDWPTCYGSFFPEMKGGVFFEHSHRLVAATVGLLTLVLCGALFGQSDSSLKKQGAAAALLVIFQGVLGGLTVLYQLPTAISTAHLATSMVFLCLLVQIALKLYCSSATQQLPKISGYSPYLKSVLKLMLVLLYLQIVLGALVRHTGAGLACSDIPLCQGSLWPAEAAPMLQVHILHRLLGGLVGIGLLYLAMLGIRQGRSDCIRGLFAALGVGVCLQIGLGLWSVYSGLQLFPVTAHLGVAALLLATLWGLRLSLASCAQNISRGKIL